MSCLDRALAGRCLPGSSSCPQAWEIGRLGLTRAPDKFGQSETKHLRSPRRGSDTVGSRTVSLNPRGQPEGGRVQWIRDMHETCIRHRRPGQAKAGATHAQAQHCMQIFGLV